MLSKQKAKVWPLSFASASSELFDNDLAETTLCNPSNPLSPHLLRHILMADDQPMDVLSLRCLGTM